MTGMTPDQVVEAKHAMAGLAELLREYFQRLRAEGFSRREAMQMVLDYQREIVRGAQNN